LSSASLLTTAGPVHHHSKTTSCHPIRLESSSYLKMQFTLALTLSFASLAFAAPRPQNDNRPVATGACCVANTSLKQDVCNVNGSTGRCVPSAANGCKSGNDLADIRMLIDPRWSCFDVYRGCTFDMWCKHIGEGTSAMPTSRRGWRVRLPWYKAAIYTKYRMPTSRKSMAMSTTFVTAQNEDLVNSSEAGTATQGFKHAVIA